MSEDNVREGAERQRAQHVDQSAAQQGEFDGLQVPASAQPSLVSLLGDPRLNGRGNQPVKIAAIQRAQQLYGNRAVRRLLANHSASVQRDTPGTATTTTSASTSTNATDEQKLNAALQNSPLGQQALAIKTKYNVTLVWVNIGAAGFEESGNKCFINRNLDPAEAASYFVHEMHHAEEYNSGNSKAPDQYKDDEEDKYVTKMVNEEIDGTMLQFEAMSEIGAPAKFSSTMSELYPQYKRVRETWINNHLKDHPGDQKGAVEAAKKKCKQLVNLWITNSAAEYDRSKSTTGSTRQLPKIAPSAMDTYEDYYVRLFRKSRRKNNAPPATGGNSTQSG